MWYTQIYADDMCVLGGKSYWENFSYAMNQSCLESGAWSPAEGSFIRGRCTNLCIQRVWINAKKHQFCDCAMPGTPVWWGTQVTCLKWIQQLRCFKYNVYISASSNGDLSWVLFISLASLACCIPDIDLSRCLSSELSPSNPSTSKLVFQCPSYLCPPFPWNEAGHQVVPLPLRIYMTLEDESQN